MKGAMASVEIFAFAATARASESADASDAGFPAEATGTTRPRRLSLVIGMPERAAAGDRWLCRVALADLHRAESLEGRDSVEALVLAVARARDWLDALAADGFRLTRDRAGVEPFVLP